LFLKSFSDTSFFLLFEEILRKDRPKDSPGRWSAVGVSWLYSRHTFEAKDYGFTMEIFEGTHSTRNGWSLLVTKEHWWAGRHGDNIRSTHWAKPLHGNRAAIMAWFKERQREIEGTL
jgi:hypothetical protein